MAISQVVMDREQELSSQLQAAIMSLLTMRFSTFTPADPPAAPTLGPAPVMSVGDAPHSPGNIGLTGITPLDLSRYAFTPGDFPMFPIDAQAPQPFTPDGSINKPDIQLPNAPQAPNFDSLPGLPSAPTVGNLAMGALSNVQIPNILSLGDVPGFRGELATMEPLDTQGIEDALSTISQLRDEVASAVATLGAAGVYVDGMNVTEILDVFHGKHDDRVGQVLTEALRLANFDISGRGYPLAPGVLSYERSKLLIGYQNELNDASRDFSEKHSELNYDLQKAQMQAKVTLATAEATTRLQGMGVILEVTKEVINAAVSIANLKVTQYRTLVDAYSTEAQVYKTELEAKKLTLDAKMQEFEQAKIQGEINQQVIQQYTAQLAAQEMLVKVYVAQVEARNAVVQSERLKIEIYQAQVEAFKSGITLEEAKVQMYDAQIKGELGKVQIYEAQIIAYRSEIEATGIKNQGVIAQITADLKKGELQAEMARVETARYGAEVERAKAEGSLAIMEYDAQIKGFLGNIDIKKAVAGIEMENRRLEVESWRTVSSTALERLRMQFQEMDIENRLKQTGAEGAIHAIQGAMSSLAAIDMNITKSGA